MNEVAPTTAGPDRVQVRGDGYQAEAGWFGPDDRPRFGWLYQPDTLTSRTGIVIVPPFGREDICAHRTLRHLAEDAARAGFIALRFDLDGTGDSAGDDIDPDRIDAWLTSIHDACDLVCNAGAAQMVVVGIRLGATLAALAATQRKDVAALAAFNAVIAGKAYLRELRAFQAAMNLPPSPTPFDEGGQETSGFLLKAETCEALKAIDLAKAAAPAPVVWLLERDDMPERSGWTKHLQTLGVNVLVRRVPDYVEMSADPHANHVAQAFIDSCIECAHSVPGATYAQPVGKPQTLRESIRLQIGEVEVIEEITSPGSGMFGIAARPRDGDAEHAVLMLNSGAIRHIGSNRTDVPLARQLAAAGLQVLRADLSGIGDSQAHQGAEENIVYGPHCVEDVGIFVAWLRARGARELTAGGMCSGAYHALRAAIAGQAIDNTYVINCLVFGPKVEFNPEGSHLFGDIVYYNESIKSAKAWRKLLTRKVKFSAIARVATWHFKARGERLGKGIVRRLRIPLRNDLGSDLQALAQRGVHVHFLFSANEPGIILLAAEAGSVVPRLCKAGEFDVQVFEGPDHTFTQRWAQELLRKTLLTILITRTGGKR